MNKLEIAILENNIKHFPDERICIIFKHNIKSCGKYSANLTSLKSPVLDNLSEKLEHLRTTTKMRCIFCRKNITKVEDVNFQIKKDVMEFLQSKSNLY